MKYKIITAGSISELEDAVNKVNAQGWIIVGSFVIDSDDGGVKRYCQTVVIPVFEDEVFQ